MWCPWQQGSWGQHGAHLGPTGPRWAPCWPHELCYLGCFFLGVPLKHNSISESDTDPLKPRQNGWYFAHETFKCISWIKIIVFHSLKFLPTHPSARKSSLISRWLGTEHATSHYLNQCWPNSLKHNIYHQPSKSWNLQTVIYYFCVLLLWAKKFYWYLIARTWCEHVFPCMLKTCPSYERPFCTELIGQCNTD